MTRRTTKIIVAGVALLVAAYGATLLAGGSDGGDGGGPVVRALAPAAGEELDSVRIERPGRTTVLRNGDAGWRVDGWPADSGEIADLRAALSGGASPELASTNAANHARMGVDSASARRLVLMPREGEPVRLLVGDEGPYAPSAYVRLPGSAEVYLLGGELPRLVRQGGRAWRDRTMVRVDTGRVDALRLRRSGEAWELRRRDGGWRVDGRPADTARVRELLSRLDGLSATDFAADTVRLGTVARSLVALSSAGDTLAALRMEQIGTEAVPRFRVRARGLDHLYEITGTVADRVVPAREELMAGGGVGDGDGDGQGDASAP